MTPDQTGESDSLTTETSKSRRNGAPEIAAQLRKNILDGHYNRRDRLPSERDLAQQFGCARGTLREALNVLNADRLVEIRPGSGTYITYELPQENSQVVEQTRPMELVDARFALEPQICRLAVLQATDVDFARLETLLKRMESAGDVASFGEADTAFHTLLAEVTRNPILIWMVGHINKVRAHQQWAKMRELTLNREIITRYNRQHRAIIDAIRGRDPEQAANEMKRHLDLARQSMTGNTV